MSQYPFTGGTYDRRALERVVFRIRNFTFLGEKAATDRLAARSRRVPCSQPLHPAPAPGILAVLESMPDCESSVVVDKYRRFVTQGETGLQGALEFACRIQQSDGQRADSLDPHESEFS